MEDSDLMKAVFMGTPEYALPVLAALLDAAYDVVGVYTQPDRSKGRSRQLSLSPVKQFALSKGLTVFQPETFRTHCDQDELETISADVIIVAAYGLLLPSRILNLPPLGCLNVHPSLLPKYRGPSPVSTAMLSGDSMTGVTILKLDQGVDTGPIVAQRDTIIKSKENASELTYRLFKIGASLLIEVLPRWIDGRIQARPQDDTNVTFTSQLSKDNGNIDWNLNAVRISNQILAYYPWPGSFTYWNGRVLKIIEASSTKITLGSTEPSGLVLSLPNGDLGIVTGEDVLRVRRLQLSGRNIVSAAEFTRGHPDIVGSKLGV